MRGLGSALGAAALATTFALPVYAVGFGLLPEGQTLQAGYRTRGEGMLHGKIDLAVIPFPGGPDVWAGPINATRLEALLTFTSERVRAEELRVGLLRWPHVRALAVERNERLGTAIGGELVALELPIPLEGTTNGRAYGIGFLGAALGYRFLNEGARGTARAHGASMSFGTRIEGLQVLSSRLDARFQMDVSYVGFLGYDANVLRARYLHAAVVGGEVQITFDLGGSPWRTVRFHDVSGASYDQARPVRGKRWRLVLANVGFEVHPLDTLSRFGNVGFVKMGLSHEY